MGLIGQGVKTSCLCAGKPGSIVAERSCLCSACCDVHSVFSMALGDGPLTSNRADRNSTSSDQGLVVLGTLF